MPRLPLLLVVAVLETTIISLPLLELGILNLPWLLLLTVLLLGACAAWQIEHLPGTQQRIAMIVAAGVAGLLAVAVRIGGLGVALGALLPIGDSQLFGPAYGTFLVALFVFWRGSSLHTHTAASVARTFSAGVFVSIVGLLFAPLLDSLESPARVAALTLQLVLLVGAGLLAQALARADEDNEAGAQRLSWRWLGILSAAVGLVALLGLGASGLFGGPAAVFLNTIWQLCIFVLMLLLLPFIWLAATLTNWLIAFLAPKAKVQPWIVPPMTLPQSPDGARELFPALPPWAVTSVVSLLALLPPLILLLLIIFMRRRRRRATEDEERQSLLSWSELQDDLRGLLRGLRNPFARPLAGLRAVLAALNGGDPDSRARRSYVRLLLALEAREHARPPANTPAEYAPEAQGALPEVSRSISTLTAAYERARYAPGSLSSESAAAAEQAWSEVDERTKT